MKENCYWTYFRVNRESKDWGSAVESAQGCYSSTIGAFWCWNPDHLLSYVFERTHHHFHQNLLPVYG